MTGDHRTRLCRVEQSLFGHNEICPEEGCPFWSSGVAERQGHCALDGIDLEGRDEFATWLLELRRELGEPGHGEHNALRTQFYRRLNEGRSD
jgi:hypothetical protein